jgi:hypothetical protein
MFFMTTWRADIGTDITVWAKTGLEIVTVQCELQKDIIELQEKL